jgi:hypothetical protein
MLEYRTPAAEWPGRIRLLEANLTDPEPRWKSLLFLGVALLITCGYFHFITSYWLPAHPGVDQNGYLVGGKQMALTGSTGIKPANPFQYVGMMWVMSGDPAGNDVWYHPKYPIGLPLLNAIPLWINWDAGKHWALLISPASTGAALLGMFLLVRLLAGSFVGVMAMILLGMNVVTLSLANNPNSHAPALAFVVWGMFLLIRWWQTGAIWRGILAGLVLGFSVTIRYLDGGLLLLPLLAAVLCALRYRGILRVDRVRVVIWLTVVAGLCGLKYFGFLQMGWDRLGIGLGLATLLCALDSPGVIRVGWHRLAACVAVAAGATWFRFRVENVQIQWIAAAAGLLAVVAIVPWWRFRLSPRSAELWRGVVAVALVVGVVLLKVPQSLSQEYGDYALMILAATFIGLMLFLYSPASWKRAAVPLLAWSVPVLWLVGFNWFAMESITGYDTTNESFNGFEERHFWSKWEFMVQQLYDYGAFFVLPLTVIGLAVMWRWNWRIAMTMLLWLLPATLFYAAYYWGLDLAGMSYLRFFLTLIPVMIVPAMWLLRHGGWARKAIGERAPGSVAMPIACGMLVAVCSWLGLRNALPTMERELAVSGNLFYTCEGIAQIAPKGSVVFTDQRGGLGGVLNFLQWRGDYDLYPADAFDSGGGRWMGGGRPRFGGGGSDAPNPRQGARRDYMRDYVYSALSDADLIAEQNKIMRQAMNAPHPRRVFVIVPSMGAPSFRSRFLNGTDLELQMITKWTEPLTLPPEPAMVTRLSPPVRGFGGGRGPQTWQVHEVVKRGSSTAEQPTTGPSRERSYSRRND